MRCSGEDVIGCFMTMNENGNRASPASILANLNKGERSKLRVYIGAAEGVGKTYKMLEDAHLLKKQGADIVIAAIGPHGREDTTASSDHSMM